MKKSICIAFFYFISFCNFIKSQHDLNHRRYWYYRARFINDFVKIGDKQGECISFPQRNYGGQNIKQVNVGPDQIDQMNMYLAALVIEFKLLSRNNQSTKETVKEIFYILNTYNRLDMEADQFWDATPPTSDYPVFGQLNKLNGFILREDMPHKFLDSNILHFKQNYKHFNYAINEVNNTNSISNNQYGYTGLGEVNKLSNSNQFSNWINFSPSQNNPDYQQPIEKLPLVHDKYYSMFFAFMFLVKYLPDNLSYYDENNTLQIFADNESNIKQEVRNITNRCHLYLRGNIFGNTASNWQMEYPNGVNLDPLDLGFIYPFYTYPLVNTICHINSSFPWNPVNCLSYSDALSITSNVDYLLISSTTAFNEDNAVFLAYNHSSSNTYPGPTPLWLKMQQNTTIWDLEWADLARKVLHQNGVFTKQNPVYENPLNQANCWGPFNFGNCNHAGCEWSATDRIEHPSRRSAGCSSTSNCIPQNYISGVFSANYPGVDYMLLHNLYYEHLNQKYDQNNNETGAYNYAYNLMDNYDEQIWPRSVLIGLGGKKTQILMGVNMESTITFPPPYGPNNPKFQITSPARIKLFQNLTSRAQIYANASPAAPNNTIQAKVEYRAGKDISLLPESGNQPGFEIKAGAEFHAYIKRYICGQDDYQSGMRQNNNDEATMYSNDYESDDMNTEIPIHYVEYPELSDSDKFPFGNKESYYTNSQEYLSKNPEALNEETLIQLLNSKTGKDNNTFENNVRFEVMPNPSTGIFKIIVNKIDENEIFYLSIFDMKGNVVYTNENFTSNELDLKHVAKGIYMLKLQSSIGKTYIKRINLIE